MEKVTADVFKKYCKEQVDKNYYVTPSMVVLRSFYVMDVEKPKEVTVKQFDWLRSIAEKELKVYKSSQ